MYIAYNNSDKKIIAVRETERHCRMNAKGIDLIAYNTWESSITDSEGVITYPSETFTIAKHEQDLTELSDYIQMNPEPGYKGGFHLKWDGTKKEIVKDDTAKDAWDLAWEWTLIRRERTRLLAETDWVVIKARENGGQVPAAWKTYRVALRDLPAEQSDKTKYSEITWPTQPS